MIKKVNGYLLTDSINHKYIVKVGSFLLAKTFDMFDYVKPTQTDFNPEVYILQVGTNDLSSDKLPKQISLDILNLVKFLKLNCCSPDIVPRDDVCKKKADEVSSNFEQLYKVINIEIISHRSVNPKRHL